MGVFEMVAVIVSVSVFGGIITKYMEMRKGSMSGDAGKQFKQMEAEVESLKKRVRNLETIVALEPSDKLLELGNEPDVKDLDSFDERLVNQLAQHKKRTR
jgi:hypothetical protein